jgi:hypothetical protein
MAKAALITVLAILFGPATLLLSLGLVLNPAAQASCLPSPSATGSTGAPTGAQPETSRLVFPLPAGSWTRSSGFGMRVHPITGERKLHTGVDLSASAGTPIIAVADGRVVSAGPASGYGHLIVIEHTVGGQPVATAYAHMHAEGIHVSVDDTVTAGQHIADVGSDGYSTGAHLHFEVRPGGATGPPIDPEPWLSANGAAEITGGDGDGCDETTGGPATPYPGTNPNGLVDDPTTDGYITEQTAHVLAQVRANFPDTAWACWSQRPGSDSEHEIGRACDGTFGNLIGTAATGPALDLGWTVTNWLKANAARLGVEYLIWQGRIWAVARSTEGWRRYDGGGMHDPTSVTGGHFDHLHFTAVS